MIAASVLLAGCSQAVDGQAQQADQDVSASPSTTRAAPPTSTTTAPAGQPPAAGAPITAVVSWIEAGTPADTGGFHSATREGEVTELGEDVAFVTPSGISNCMTDSGADGALACLVDLTAPPPQPAEVYGGWKGNWVDFAGPTLEVGSVRSDPGRFSTGTGAELPYGQALSFGDYRCRTDPAGLFCVNYAHRSAAKFSDAGVEPFGCLQQVTPPADIGAKFSC